MTRPLATASWFRSGEPWVWLNAAAVAASLLLVIGLVAAAVLVAAIVPFMLRGGGSGEPTPTGHFMIPELHSLARL